MLWSVCKQLVNDVRDLPASTYYIVYEHIQPHLNKQIQTILHQAFSKSQTTLDLAVCHLKDKVEQWPGVLPWTHCTSRSDTELHVDAGA